MNIEQLKTAVCQLSADEFLRFREWFEEHASDRWDEQIEADARAGRLDHLIARADANYEAGQFTELKKEDLCPCVYRGPCLKQDSPS